MVEWVVVGGGCIGNKEDGRCSQRRVSDSAASESWVCLFFFFWGGWRAFYILSM